MVHRAENGHTEKNDYNGIQPPEELKEVYKTVKGTDKNGLF